MIETARLVLRPWRDEDRAAFAAINADPRVHGWLGGPISPEATNAMVDRINAAMAANGFSFWAAEHRVDGRLAGMIGLSRVAAGDLPVGPCVEIGWRLHPDFWGLGLASEGAKAALDWGFGPGSLAEIIAFTAQTNLASQAVMRRIGMTPDPSRDFDHPRLAQDHPLRRHVVWTSKGQA
ncbi:GNAT family N-acetyltransferase [Phenylobacterium sp.]|uniref:GNAT family N-acetyltransferase n=1 Tax=Phenylobacterium sp. TaxID=1871053 RepID=UPI0025D19478|nr:GNAT family N-acetyltransferase [Phenylobacterium sp.]MCA6264417.1 GNAT family N-acetyltransferase [Phenylobacterium sp.]MCA6280677.1 GNAT family N-acetyltransferase [Phenylobacterium sp.]MCA6313167.1 GNAT family N-acetyltransferase [Phenylobacterium sp.]MCA6332241.1 GNAT family N-acetyltransferase [Phenylobacterium sp.]